ncbi:MAG: Rieske 2Fe-2S domain-containing protein [Gammaproteobacteria bacterium]|nr:Rieske 2Fe-2S domain-containing protein [Gammaproteobacteria bacterium]
MTASTTRFANPADVTALVRDDEVHKDVYIDADVFQLEMDHLWPSTWIFLGHDSQIPMPGDFMTADIAAEPLIMLRDKDGCVVVVKNRCAHKGAKLVSALSGKLSSNLRCPYHGWTFRLDGSLRSIPEPKGYAGSKYDLLASDRTTADKSIGLSRVKNVEIYRGFVFVKLSDAGLGFHEFFGDSLSSIDNMADRSPEGRLEVVGGTFRYMHNCNWKMFVENLNDTMHPMVAHHSSAGTVKKLWYADHDKTDVKPMVVEQFEPFVSNYKFFDDMGVKIFPNGHSYTGVNFSIHSAYSAIPGYHDSLVNAYGKEKAENILATNRHNTVYYPSLTIKGAIQTLRIARPIAHDKTLLESWTLRLVGASDEHLKRTLMYSRLINAPTSVVGHDDLHCYRAIQEGLASSDNEWVSLHRRYDESERIDISGEYKGNSEVSMRGQFRAWRERIVASMQAQAS